eukprot:822184-Pelagomonas_calceolata.AAC.10
MSEKVRVNESERERESLSSEHGELMCSKRGWAKPYNNCCGRGCASAQRIQPHRHICSITCSWIN